MTKDKKQQTEGTPKNNTSSDMYIKGVDPYKNFLKEQLISSGSVFPKTIYDTSTSPSQDYSVINQLYATNTHTTTHTPSYIKTSACPSLQDLKEELEFLNNRVNMLKKEISVKTTASSEKIEKRNLFVK
jgi:hypothetical protein